MNDKQKSLLSSWIDDEASSHTIAVICKQLEEDQEARLTLMRYQMISDHLHGEKVNRLHMNIVDAVSQQLESEPTWQEKPHLSKWQILLGGAIAASVAAISIIIGLRWLPSESGFQLDSGAVAEQIEPIEPERAEAVRWKKLDEADQLKLAKYLQQHSQSMPAMMPYAAYVSYQNGHQSR